jgi:hypothetical protein
MKILLILALILLVGCFRPPINDHPKFYIGDCVSVDRIISSPDIKDDIRIILGIGYDKYYYRVIKHNWLKGKNSESYIKMMDRVYTKIECPIY